MGLLVVVILAGAYLRAPASVFRGIESDAVSFISVGSLLTLRDVHTKQGLWKR